MKSIKSYMRLILASLACSVCCGNLNADIITTGQVPITSSGQNFLVNVNAASLWGSGDGTLTFTAQGDFDDGVGETVDLYLDGNLIGTAGRLLPGSTFTQGTQLGMQGLHTLQATFNVSAAVMQTILGADTSVLFRLDLSPNVGGNQAFVGDYVSASLSYNAVAVPEPASFAAMALASGGFVAYRKRKSRRV